MDKPMPISPCPACKSDCNVAGGILWGVDHPMSSSAPWVACSNSICGYRGPFGATPEEAIFKHNALCRPHSGQTPAGVRAIPISEIRALWAPLEHLSGLESAGKFMSGMAELVRKHDHE